MPHEAEIRMIDEAERIAAEQGLGAMSLRSVQTAAGQRNKSAAQYHFGSREGLIERIAAYRMAPINERRTELLEALDPTPDMQDLVSVLVVPTAEAVLGVATSYWARFVVAGWSDPTVADVVSERLEGHAFRTIRRRVIESLDDLPADVRSRRVDQAFGLVFHTLARYESRSVDADGVRYDAEIVADLVATCTAVLECPYNGAPQKD